MNCDEFVRFRMNNDIRRSWMQLGLVAAVVLVFGFLIGCGGGSSSAVEGKVTVKGVPLTKAVVNFVNNQGGAAAGELDDSGVYKIPEGLAPGSYRVSVVPQSTQADAPMPGKAPTAVKAPLDAKYTNDATSGLVVELKPGKNSEVNFFLD